MKSVKLYCVIHCDSNSSGGGDLNSAHLTDDAAWDAAAQLARDLWPVYTDDEPFPEDRATDVYATAALLRDFDDVSLEVEVINVPETLVAAMQEALTNTP